MSTPINQIIRVEGVHKSYGSLKVLNDLNLSVNKGEKVSIIGPSGCGKSTLLRMINLLEKPDRGRVFIQGREITAAGANIDKMRSRIGMVFQKPNPFSTCTVSTRRKSIWTCWKISSSPQLISGKSPTVRLCHVPKNCWIW